MGSGKILGIWTFNNKVISAIIIIIISILIIDTSVGKISDFISSNQDSDWKILLFVFSCCVYAIGQYLILKFVNRKINEIKFKQGLHLTSTHRIVKIIQYVLVTIVIFVILQVLVKSYYNVALLTSAMIVSYALAIFVMQLLARRFISWFKANKNYVIFLYGISSAMIAVNAILTLAYVSVTLLEDKPADILPHVGGMIPHYAPGSLIDLIDDTFVISSIASFMITWVATAMLLRHYSRKIGTIKYWLIVSIPLAYFVSQFLDLFVSLFAPLLSVGPVSFLIIFTLGFILSKPVGGILFAIAFWVIAKRIPHGNIVRTYMLISAFGFALLFVSNQAIVLVTAPYPPFGLATISFVGLSSYLVLIGIYYSAISVAQDVELRKSIRKIAVSESRFLDMIGTAHMEQEIENRVVAIAKSHQDTMTEETGMTSSLSEDDIKEYLQMVLKEVKGKDNKNLK